jgi:hypothetical protein
MTADTLIGLTKTMRPLALTLACRIIIRRWAVFVAADMAMSAISNSERGNSPLARQKLWSTVPTFHCHESSIHPIDLLQTVQFSSPIVYHVQRIWLALSLEASAGTSRPAKRLALSNSPASVNIRITDLTKRSESFHPFCRCCGEPVGWRGRLIVEFPSNCWLAHRQAHE